MLPRPDLNKIRTKFAPVDSEDMSIGSNTKLIPKKSVCFHSIEVRGYEQIIGDHPCVSYGPPVGLGWRYHEFGSFNIDKFEATRGPRRSLRHLVLNYYERMSTLQQIGVPPDVIKEAERNVSKIKNQRALTKALLPAARLEEAMQSAKRKAARRKSKQGLIA